MKLLFIDSLFAGEIVKAISWTLIHSLWIGFATAIVAGVVIMLTRRSTAQLRYNFLGSLLILFVLAVSITFAVQMNKSSAESATSGLSAMVVVDDPDQIRDMRVNTNLKEPLLTQFVDYFNNNASIVVLAWAIIFFAKCIKLFGGIYYLHRLRTIKTKTPSEEWQEKVKRMALMLGVSHHITFLESELVKVPVAFGYLKNTILIPVGLLTNLSTEQVESILLHELAHIKRKDYIINLLQNFTETVFFFNPGILWISSLIREEREACCDDMVMEHTSHKQTYLEALVSFHEYTLASSAYAMSFAGRKNFLLYRVRRLLTMENKKLNVMEKLMLGLSLIGIMSFTVISIEVPRSEAVREGAAFTKPFMMPEDVKLQEKPDVQVEKKPHIIAMKKQAPEKPVPPQVIRIDTIPGEKKKATKPDPSGKRYDFRSINSSIHKNDGESTYDVEAVDAKGVRYKVRKENDVLTELVIDGVSIPKSEFKNHQDVLDAIEHARAGAANKKTKVPVVIYKPAKVETISRAPKKEPAKPHSVKPMKSGVKSTPPTKVKLAKGSQFDSRQNVQHIINDLRAHNLIEQTEDLSFTLNNDKLIVNGQKQPEEVYGRFREKYIKNPKDRFIYIRSKGSTQTTIHIED